MTEQLLLCANEHAVTERAARALAERGWIVVRVGSVQEARRAVQDPCFGTVVLDLALAGAEDTGALPDIARMAPDVDLVLLAPYSHVEGAVAAMQLGAADYLTKPVLCEELELRLERLREMRGERQELGRLRAAIDEGARSRDEPLDSPAMKIVRDRVRLFADGTAPVLLTGEVGTGKERTALALHERGERSAAPFLTVQCRGMPAGMLAVALFGSEMGSPVNGALARAGRGTLLVADVDALDLDLQALLVRLLVHGSYRPVGGGALRTSEARIVATAETDLARRVEEGAFREDLRRALALEIHLPPLRHRGDDVLVVARHLLATLGRGESRAPRALSPEAAALLRTHRWPGNVGELRRVIASADASAHSDVIEVSDLPGYLSPAVEAAPPFTLHLDAHDRQIRLADLLHRFEREVVDWALARAQGVEGRAASILGVPASSIEGLRRSGSRFGGH